MVWYQQINLVNSPYVETPHSGIRTSSMGSNITLKIVYPPGKPGSAALRRDKKIILTGRLTITTFLLIRKQLVTSAYWKWNGDKWKLFMGMTDPERSRNRSKFHEDAKDDEYAYSDRDSL